MIYDYVIGVDVGKYSHYACVIDANNNVINQQAIKQSEQDLQGFFTQYTHTGTTLVVVDQPNNIGRLPVAVAKTSHADVKYLPGLAMRQLARAQSTTAKTDPRDAFVIAQAGRNMPTTLRETDRDQEVFQQLKVLDGIDDDLKRAYTRLINQIRSALVGSYPEFEHTLHGDRIHRQWILALLARYGGPTQLAKLGKRRAITFAKKHNARNPERILDPMFAAIKQQTIHLPGAAQCEMGIKFAAQDALTKREHRKHIEAEVLTLIDSVPLTDILLSMPGIGPSTAAKILMTVGDFSDFNSASELASYAGLCPTTKQSGTSINSHGVNRAGNKKLKNALWQSSFSAIQHHERSRQFYDRKRQEGKRHNAAIICLARKRLNVLFAMVKNATFYSDDFPRTT